jgi:hypothetical protein
MDVNVLDIQGISYSTTVLGTCSTKDKEEVILGIYSSSRSKLSNWSAHGFICYSEEAFSHFFRGVFGFFGDIDYISELDKFVLGLFIV